MAAVAGCGTAGAALSDALTANGRQHLYALKLSQIGRELNSLKMVLLSSRRNNYNSRIEKEEENIWNAEPVATLRSRPWIPSLAEKLSTTAGVGLFYGRLCAGIPPPFSLSHARAHYNPQ